jgi:hypothetical protein
MQAMTPPCMPTNLDGTCLSLGLVGDAFREGDENAAAVCGSDFLYVVERIKPLPTRLHKLHYATKEHFIPPFSCTFPKAHP